MPRKLVLFVEGEGDEQAVPILVKKRLTELNAWQHVTLDEKEGPFTLEGGVAKLLKGSGAEWLRLLQAALKRRNVGAVLLLLDGDAKPMSLPGHSSKETFCAADVARCLAARAREVGAGSTFSVAVAFALQEYESWLLAGIDSLRGKPLPDGRPGVRADAELDPSEVQKRGAKDVLRRMMQKRVYKPSIDQGHLTQLVDLGAIRLSDSRSFRRFDRAVEQLVAAMRTSEHIASPSREDQRAE